MRIPSMRGIIAGVALAIIPASASAQARDEAATTANACPVPPAALLEYRASGELPPVTPADVAAYRAYVELVREKDWASLCRYRDDNQALAGKPRPRVVLLGDSITEYWKTRDPALFSDGIVDRGVASQTSGQMLLRFYQDVIALRPYAVHIMAGTNDLGEVNGPTTDRQFQDNIRAMVDLARVHDIKVILASVPPAAGFRTRPELRPAERIRAWNSWLREFAQAQDLVFVDYHAVLTDAEGGMKSGYSKDGVHPNEIAYRQMDERFRAALAAAERR